MHRTKVLLRHQFFMQRTVTLTALLHLRPSSHSTFFSGENGVFNWGVVPAAEPLAVETSTHGWNDHFD